MDNIAGSVKMRLNGLDHCGGNIFGFKRMMVISGIGQLRNMYYVSRKIGLRHFATDDAQTVIVFQCFHLML